MQVKRTYHHGDLAKALVSEARQSVERNGVNKLSLRGCARALNVDVAAVYRHFRNKDDVLRAVVNEGAAAMAQRMRDELSALSLEWEREAQDVRGERSAAHAVARFQAVGRGYVAFAVEHPKLFELMFSGGALYKHNASDGRTLPINYQLLVEALDGLVDAEVITSAQRRGAETMAWSLVHGLSMIAIHEVAIDPLNLDDVVEHAAHVLVRGFAAL